MSLAQRLVKSCAADGLQVKSVVRVAEIALEERASFRRRPSIGFVFIVQSVVLHFLAREGAV